MNEQITKEQLLKLTTDIVAAHVSKNDMPRQELPSFIQEIYGTLVNVKSQGLSAQPSGSLVPAVPIKKSVTPDHIICLEDGKKLKMIKRHLKAVYNMSIEEYRQRWGLPADYPAVAPNYAKQRSELAKVIGLGTSGRKKRKAS
jgi:predicted transcriptional regulator